MFEEEDDEEMENLLLSIFFRDYAELNKSSLQRPARSINFNFSDEPDLDIKVRSEKQKRFFGKNQFVVS